MRVGLQVPNFTVPGGAGELRGFLKRVAQEADAGGMYSLWVMDHFFQIRGVGPAEDPMLEGYTTLGFMAGVTEKIKLGTMVTGVVYRYPAILVKTVTTLDVVSGGRAYFGVGAAWNEQESRGLGVRFPPVKERFERLEETLQIAQQMWSESEEPYHGKHNQLERTLNSPQPLTKPHPPILVGGMGENKTMRLIATYADACNWFAYDMAVVQAKMDLLKRRCDEVGRDYNAIEKTVLTTVDLRKESVAQVAERARTLAGMGITHFIFNAPQLMSERDFMGRVAKEVIPALAEI